MSVIGFMASSLSGAIAGAIIGPKGIAGFAITLALLIFVGVMLELFPRRTHG